ncbi:MAG: 3-hydroxyacyl-CoA dehydrogenase NAD-binding domain-containing protein [Sterolibacterium sp.]|nr:3-hydroxyacyl-CoA dehydrogenase NAD-binding domain-containing protein [Sterolibacterium sp.]
MTRIYDGPCVHLLALKDGVVELCFDRRDDAVNKLDGPALADLAAAVGILGNRPDVRGLLISSGKEGFLAGADIGQLLPKLNRSDDEIAALLRVGVEAFTALADLNMPSVTAINGFAMGGGLETALSSDYRVLSTSAQIGLPEVGLGIIPGMSGTARLPRLTGSKVALDWIVGARSYKAEAALQSGVVDAVAGPTQLRDEALALLQRAMAGQLDWRARRAQCQGPFALDQEALARARQQAARAGVHLPAARIAVELLEAAAGVGFQEALDLELKAFLRAARTPAAGALMIQFLNNQQLRKGSRSLAKSARPVKRAAVLGAGIMGGGIACSSALSGVPILMKDIAQSALESGQEEARKLLAKQVASGRLTQDKATAMLASITPTLEMNGFDDVDLVIEAVIEKMAIKHQLLTEVEAKVRPGTVLASNTSSLSIGEMAEVLQRPGDFVGMHFFNPVPLMPLVEIIRGPKSSQEAIATAVSYVLTLGKVPLVAKDCPGFLVNRLLAAYLFGFMQIIHDGADFAVVDRAMEAFGWPMGPAYLQDVVGIDTLDKALAGIAAGYPRMRLQFETALQFMARLGRYGQKNGLGFYRYETDPAGKPKRSADPEVYRLLAQIQPSQGVSFSDEQIVERLMMPMVIEAALCLDEQVADGAAEIDAAMLLGAGFPRHLGGPLWYADRIGLGELVKRCERYLAQGGLYVPGEGLRDRAAKGGCFYPQAR